MVEIEAPCNLNASRGCGGGITEVTDILVSQC
jgi:hypothetical protein